MTCADALPIMPASRTPSERQELRPTGSQPPPASGTPLHSMGGDVGGRDPLGGGSAPNPPGNTGRDGRRRHLQTAYFPIATPQLAWPKPNPWPGILMAMLLGAWTLSSAACTSSDSPSGYGLKRIELEVPSEELSKLKLGTLTQTPVSCWVQLGDQRSACRVAVAGTSSRDNPKKSLDLERSIGDGAWLHERLSAMPDDASGIRGFLARDVFGYVGLPTPDMEPVALWLNREYLGLYSRVEPIDETFFARRGDPAKVAYKARAQLGTLESTGNVESAFKMKLGDTGYSDLEQLIRSINDERTQANADLEELADIDAMLRYMAASAFVNNWDGIHNNYFLVRTELEPRFRIFPWDLDCSFDGKDKTKDGRLFATNALMRRLYAHHAEGYQRALATLTREATVAALSARVEELAETVAEARSHDPWLSQVPLEAEVEAIRTYVTGHGNDSAEH